MDCTHDIFKNLEYFDCIVCDPPYGLRAAPKSTGLKESIVKRREEKKDVVEERIKAKTEEEMDQIKSQVIVFPTKSIDMKTTVVGLYELSRKVLKPGGRLVFLYHIYNER